MPLLLNGASGTLPDDRGITEMRLQYARGRGDTGISQAWQTKLTKSEGLIRIAKVCGVW